MEFDSVLLSRLQFAFVIIRAGTPVGGLPTRYDFVVRRSARWLVPSSASQAGR